MTLAFFISRRKSAENDQSLEVYIALKFSIYYSASFDFVPLPLPSRYHPVTVLLPFLATVTHRLSPLPQRFSPSMTVHDRP